MKSLEEMQQMSLNQSFCFLERITSVPVQKASPVRQSVSLCESLDRRTVLIPAPSEKPDGCCCFRLKLFLAALLSLILIDNLATGWNGQAFSSLSNIGHSYLFGWAWKGLHSSLFFFFHSSVAPSAPRVTSPNWSWQRVSLQLSPRSDRWDSFSARGFQLKWIQTRLTILREGGKKNEPASSWLDG